MIKLSGTYVLNFTAEPDIRDSSEKTALDYATEKSLHYCTLLLTQSEDHMEGVDK